MAGLRAALRPGGLVLLCLAAGAACSRDDEPLRTEVQRLALSEGEQVGREVERVARRGRDALPMIEAILHTADEKGRQNLVGAIRRIGDPEAVPLLMHLAAYDPAGAVRGDAESALTDWSRGDDPRARRARTSLRRLDELRKTAEPGPRR